ncbi:hypothetical protein SAY86_004665 [Trapa natans]|uniref:Uncharacterized protein n=1 Tax=Trapa natans TaxID=22666 RepID=A0AAN7N709_TRANT|nr:hypothetical protein SAY86_004665 [Trapa natans]
MSWTEESRQRNKSINHLAFSFSESDSNNRDRNIHSARWKRKGIHWFIHSSMHTQVGGSVTGFTARAVQGIQQWNRETERGGRMEYILETYFAVYFIKKKNRGILNKDLSA